MTCPDPHATCEGCGHCTCHGAAERVRKAREGAQELADAATFERAARIIRRRYMAHGFVQEPDPERVKNNSFGYVDRTTALGVLESDARWLRVSA